MQTGEALDAGRPPRRLPAPPRYRLERGSRTLSQTARRLGEVAGWRGGAALRAPVGSRPGFARSPSAPLAERLSRRRRPERSLEAALRGAGAGAQRSPPRPSQEDARPRWGLRRLGERFPAASSGGRGNERLSWDAAFSPLCPLPPRAPGEVTRSRQRSLLGPGVRGAARYAEQLGGLGCLQPWCVNSCG